MESIFRNVIAFMGQVMEARLKRLNLLMQQAERKINLDKCCADIQCCQGSKKELSQEKSLKYYFHK